MSWNPEAYVAAVNFASQAHQTQKMTGTDEPYLRHVVSVAAELMAALAVRDDVDSPDLAVQCALLHDVVEDTPVTLAQLEARFGAEVASGVSALTKNASLPDKVSRMNDSLKRIRAQPHEVWMVKLADRITNLQPPPAHWNEAKIASYREEAREIHAQLGAACSVLGPRLLAKIETY